MGKINEIEDTANRVVTHETPKLLRKGEYFYFDGKIYTSKDESIMVRSNASTGRYFSPLNGTQDANYGTKTQITKTEDGKSI